MDLTTDIRPEDTIRIDGELGTWLVTEVEPNPYGGPDTISYRRVDDSEEWQVGANRTRRILR
jgi:hypothetical protein